MSVADEPGSDQLAELKASRARIVAAAEETLRRRERDLHDGAQQRLVHAAIALTLLRDAVEGGSAAAGLVEEALEHVARAGRDLRHLAQRLMPHSLGLRGLGAGLDSLVADLALPVDLRVSTPRLPTAVEVAAYRVAAEAVTNAAAHAEAERVELCVQLDGSTLVVEVRDDGVGGADPGRGTGLTNLVDRVDAAGGRLWISSPVGSGTVVRAELPVPPFPFPPIPLPASGP